MTRIDYVVLEWLSDKKIAAPPKVIYLNAKEEAEISHTQVKRRCLRLNKMGLLYRDEQRGNNYAISDFGEAYLRSEVSKEALEAVDDYARGSDGFEDKGNIDVETVLRTLKDAGYLTDS